MAAGRAEQAIPILERAEQQGDSDWQVMSALGSAYDQKGLYQKARAQYRRRFAPIRRTSTVMNNLAMSYALEGNLKKAEAELRAADALPRSRSEPRIRQNLALVVGLQGRFEEATQDRPAGPAARAGAGEHGLSEEDAVAAEHLAADQRQPGLKGGGAPVHGALSLGEALPLR